jgi:hypothetical protein
VVHPSRPARERVMLNHLLLRKSMVIFEFEVTNYNPVTGFTQYDNSTRVELYVSTVLRRGHALILLGGIHPSRPVRVAYMLYLACKYF